MTTTYFLNLIMGNVFLSQVDPKIPENYYIGLSTTAPDISGSNVTEPTGGNYSRVLITSALSAPENGQIKNSSDIDFPESTEDWGTVTHYVLYDSQDGGNLLMYEAFESGKLIQSESQARFKANSLTFTLKNPE